MNYYFLDIALLFASLIFIIAIILWFRGQQKISFSLLIIAGLLLGIHSIYFDNFLHPWDERYHAVVALNAMEDPYHLKLMPEKLIDWWPYSEWYACYTWLHKQPLFSWQMALGMKIFGTSLQGMRSASVLMYVMLGIAVFRSVRIYYPNVAIWPTILTYTSPFLLFLVNGRQGIDHNDIAFISWTAIAFWAFISYSKKPVFKYALAIGLACGAAMLTKWLAGSLMLVTTALYLLLNKDFSLKSWGHWLFAVGIAALVFMPWQIYNYINHTELFLKEWEYNGRHFFDVVENHVHPWYYHLQVWYEQFRVFTYLTIIALISLLWTAKKHLIINLTILGAIVGVMGFYALAQTKLPSFTIILIPFVSFFTSSFLATIRPTLIGKLGLLLIVAYSGNILFTQYLLKREEGLPTERSLALKALATPLKNSLPENAVIFNAPSMMYPDFIFYTHRLTYERIPSMEEIEVAKAHGKIVFILTPEGLIIPDEIREQCQLIDASSIQFYYPDLPKTQ